MVNQIETELLDSLNRINFVFKNRDIRLECIKDFDGFSIFGHRFGPFEKGKKYRLKLFLAAPFLKNNILKIAPSDKCDDKDVQRYAFLERDAHQLIDHNTEFLFDKIREFRRVMVKEVRDERKPHGALKNFDSYFSNIIDSRLLKLLKLSKTELSVNDEKRLTRSEAIINSKMHDLLKTWRDYYFRRK